MDFHPYYRNENEVVRKKEYYTNYITATCPESVFAQSSDKLNEVRDTNNVVVIWEPPHSHME